MLDEIIEYSEYTCNLNTDHVMRLMPEVFKWKNRMSGLTRALLIIARKELTDRGYFSEAIDSKEQVIDDVKQALREWLGFVNETDAILSKYDSWLKKYYISRIQTEEDERVKPWGEIEKKNSQYEKKLFSDKKTERNDMLAVTYEGIIADAIYMGPLEQYYLVCKDGFGEKLSKNGKTIDSQKKKDAEKIDNVLKLVCTYLIRKRYTGNMANRVNNAELANWTQNREIFKGEYFKGMKFADKNLITKKTIANNYTKVIICPEFITEYDFRIIRKEELAALPEAYIIFSDVGAGKPLIRI